MMFVRRKSLPLGRNGAKQLASCAERGPDSDGCLELVSLVLVYSTGNTMVVACPESFTVLRRSIACDPKADRVLGVFRRITEPFEDFVCPPVRRDGVFTVTPCSLQSVKARLRSRLRSA